MKRAFKYLLAVAATAMLGVLAALGWLAGTTAGARWLLGAVSRHTALKISARQVEGRIFGRLRLAGVRITLPRQEGEVDTLELRWQPYLLLAGELAVRELTLRGVRVLDHAPPAAKAPELAWPRLPAITRLLDGRVDLLRVEGLTYRRPEGKPTDVTTLSAALVWRDRLLSVGRLSLVTPAGRVAGKGMAGFRRPSLRLDLDLAPARPAGGMDRITLRARLLPARAPEQLAGRVTVSGASGPRQSLELTGEVGMTRNSFNLRELRLTSPGRRGTVSGEGTILLTAPEPALKLRLKAAGLDLARELKTPTDLSGELAFDGGPSRYRGRFALANKGKEWRTARLAGSFQGDSGGVTLAPLELLLLDGTVQGELAVGWRAGLSLSGTLRGRRLNPALIAPDWRGEVNLDLSGKGAWSKTEPLRGELRGTLLDSTLHGRALTGELRADYAEGDMNIGRLVLRGEGFDLNAAGRLTERLAFSARISDFSRLIPETAGELRAAGWLRRHAGIVSGAVSGKGRKLAAKGARIGTAELAARLGEGKGYPFQVTAALRSAQYGQLRADAVALELGGTTERHSADATLRAAGAELRLSLSGAYRQKSWQGEITRFSGRDSVGPWNLRGPARLAVSAAGMTLSPLELTGVREERLAVAGDLARNPLRGSLRAEWERLNLARAGHWLKEPRLTGATSGNVRFTLPAGERFTLTGSATAAGTVTVEGRRLTVQRSSLNIAWDERGLRAGTELLIAEGGMLKGTLSSAAPPTLAVPEEGNVALDWSGIDLVLLRPWLPEEVGLEGVVTGRLAGNLLAGKRLDLDGNAALARGKIRWQRPEGELTATLRSAEAVWSWRGESLRGTFALALAEYGQAKGSFQLPLPARIPAAFDPRGAVEGSLTGELREKGVLAAFFPGLVQESHGELAVDLRVGGKWEKPQLDGTLRLAKAGGYLPKGGIRVKDLQLTAQLSRDQVRIDSFRAASGPGRLEGTADIRLSGWRVAQYQGSITGERFQVVHLPELQVQGSPRLTFEGTPEKLTVRGDLALPELLVYGPPARAAIAPSKDVIIEGAPPPSPKAPPFALDILVRVTLGDRVVVKAEGIDAQLGGEMELAIRGIDNITSTGEIKVVKGRYKAYGLDLQIVRGRLFYAGGTIDRPTLDFLALRTIGDVRAGVTVGGPPQAPLIKLYSEPAMPDVDILAYVVLGHPLGASRDQASLVAQAGGFLLSAGESVALQDQIKSRLGLSTLGIETAGEAGAGRMGYKPIAVAPPGVAPARPAAGLSQSVLTVGKYLTPKLYISYGRSLFTGGNLFRLRYDIFKNWQVETETGAESGADLYYKIELD